MIPPTMAMMTEVIAEMTASMARPMAEMIEPYRIRMKVSKESQSVRITTKASAP